MLAKTQKRVNCHISLVVTLAYTALWKLAWRVLRILKTELPQSSIPLVCYTCKGNQISLKKRCLVNSHVYHDTIQKPRYEIDRGLHCIWHHYSTPPLSDLPGTHSLPSQPPRWGHYGCVPSHLTSFLVFNQIIWDLAPRLLSSEHYSLLDK